MIDNDDNNNDKDRGGDDVERRRKRHGVIRTCTSTALARGGVMALAALSFAALTLAGTGFAPVAHAAAPPDSTPPADSVPAAEAGSFAVQPWTPAGAGGRDYFIYEFKAGTAYSDKVTVSNDSDQKATYAVYATDAVNTDDGSFSLLREEDKPKDVGTWVELGATQYTLEPHTQVTIPFSVTVPADAISGDHVGAIVAQKIADASNPDGIGLNVRVRVGARLYVRIDGAKTPSLAVDSFTVAYDAPGSPFASSTAHINYVLTNTGNVRLSPTAVVQMAGVFGLGEQHVPDRQIPEILPGSSIQISEVLQGVKPYVHLTADLTVAVPDEPSVVVHTSIDQWAIPWLAVGAIALILAAIIGRRLWTRRRRMAPA